MYVCIYIYIYTSLSLSIYIYIYIHAYITSSATVGAHNMILEILDLLEIIYIHNYNQTKQHNSYD